MALMLVGCASTLEVRELRYPNGSRRVEEHVNGVPHGRFTVYRPGGVIAKRGSYKNGKQHGLFTSYDPAGKPVEKILYDEGQIVWKSSEAAELAPAITASLEQEIVAPPGLNPALPSFATLDLTALRSNLAVAMSLQTPGEGWGQRSVLFASYKWQRVVGYASLQGSLSSAPGDLTLGRPVGEVGGGVVADVGSHSVLVRAGVSGPLAGDTTNSFVVNAATIRGRLTDLVLAQPRAVGFRTAGSLRGRRAALVYQLDVGVDAAVSHASDEETPSLDENMRLIGHVAAGIGYETAQVLVTGELVTVAQERVGASTSDLLLHSFGLSAQLKTSVRVQPGLAIVGPFLSGDNDGGIAVTATAHFDLD